MTQLISEVVETLRDAGLWPRNVAADDGVILASNDAPVDLLPVLREVWRVSAAGDSRGSPNRVVKWLEQLAGSSARLTLGVPAATTASERWLGTRLAWWPRGIPDGRRVGLASSRLGRALETHSAWFTYLRAACAKVEPTQNILFTAAESTPARFVERCARLFGLRVLRADLANDSVSWERWVRNVITRPVTTDANSPTESWYEVFLSPPLAETAAVDQDARDVRLAPARDRALVALSDQLLVFHVRGGGNLYRLLRARLSDPAWPVASVFAAIGPQLVSRKLVDELLQNGAVGWLLLENLPAELSSLQTRPQLARTIVAPEIKTIAAAPIIAPPPSNDWQFLTHCTRRQNERWPDESEEEFIDNLVLCRDEADHSALATLKRIVTTQRLRATAKAVRGGFPVVSFTAVPLDDLPRLRVFRTHRGRWDFEPYGISVRRDWLERLGVQAVRYGDDALWQSLDEGDRPFFQKSCSDDSRDKRAIDWTVEQEWRHLADVDLTELPDDAAFVFVPTRAEAERLARVSRWPVVVAGQ